jgi:addiction module HigA family antidote
MVLKNGMPPIHPGEIIREIIMPEIGMSVTDVAKTIGVSRQMFHDILAEKKPLSAATCIKFAKLIGSTADHWMRLQASYDLKKAEQDAKLQAFVAGIQPVKVSDDAHL